MSPSHPMMPVHRARGEDAHGRGGQQEQSDDHEPAEVPGHGRQRSAGRRGHLEHPAGRQAHPGHPAPRGVEQHHHGHGGGHGEGAGVLEQLQGDHSPVPVPHVQQPGDLLRQPRHQVLLQRGVGPQERGECREEDHQQGGGGEQELVGQTRRHEGTAVERVLAHGAHREQGHGPGEGPREERAEASSRGGTVGGQVPAHGAESTVLGGQPGAVHEGGNHRGWVSASHARPHPAGRNGRSRARATRRARRPRTRARGPRGSRRGRCAASPAPGPGSRRRARGPG